MEAQSTASLLTHFTPLADPRLDRQKQPQLIDLVLIAICAVLAGANDWVAVESFGKAKQA